MLQAWQNPPNVLLQSVANHSKNMSTPFRDCAHPSCWPTLLCTQGDVRELKDCEKAIDAVTDKWGRLDILVNAAAGNFLAPAEVLSPKGFKTGVA